jgi:hypothetical protein
MILNKKIAMQLVLAGLLFSGKLFLHLPSSNNGKEVFVKFYHLFLNLGWSKYKEVFTR